MSAPPGPPRETLLAQVAALRALVERQREYIGSMRASRFWRLRDAYFALRRVLGRHGDPLPVPSCDELATLDAAYGDRYQLYRARNRLGDAEVERLRQLVRLLQPAVAFTLLVDARGASREALERTLDSLAAQFYPSWTVQVRTDESLPAFAPDAFVGGLFAGDVLEPDALLAAAVPIAAGADVVYTDEDRFAADGVPREPAFKPDWSPETLLSRDYVGRLCLLRGDVLTRSGGLEVSAGSAMWYDALLRVSERTERIVHVPRVLCHRGSLGDVVAADGRGSAERALARRGEVATVEVTGAAWPVRFSVPADERVGIVIPTRDRADLLERCLASIFGRSTHASFAVVVVDNGSQEAATRELFTRWSQREPHRFAITSDPAPFNFSRLVNRGVAASDAPYVLLLNNDVEVISPGWLEALLGQARRPSIGAVGAQLLYADGTIQHAGVILGGVLGLAGHAYRTLPSDDEPNRPAGLRFDTNYLAVTGACLMVARAKFDRAGGFDESLPVAYNDVDFCLKLHAASLRNVLVPCARLYHFESKSRGGDDTPAKARRAMDEVALIRARWPRWASSDPYYNPNLTRDAEDFSLPL